MRSIRLHNVRFATPPCRKRLIAYLAVKLEIDAGEVQVRLTGGLVGLNMRLSCLVPATNPIIIISRPGVVTCPLRALDMGNGFTHSRALYRFRVDFRDLGTGRSKRVLGASVQPLPVPRGRLDGGGSVGRTDCEEEPYESGGTGQYDEQSELLGSHAVS